METLELAEPSIDTSIYKHFYLDAHGCQMNVYDADRMKDIFVSQGLQETDSLNEADILLVNTCSIREKAEEKVFSLLGRWRDHKLQKTHCKIIVAGCVASQEGEAIFQRAPFVDIVIGPQAIHRLPQLLLDAHSGKKRIIDLSFPEIEKFDQLPVPSNKGPEAFVTVIEGCSKYCSFCIVPYTRGEEVSRSPQDILQEVEHQVTEGAKTIHLLGQTVNAYRGFDEMGEMYDLADIILEIAKIEQVFQIRFTTSHPIEMSDSLIDCFARSDKLPDFLHLPVQSGSDKILHAMKRAHTSLEYREIIAKLRAIRPNLCLSSDFIVGFPGETEEDFAETLELIEDLNFDHSYSFIYSDRPGTPASNLPDSTSLETKKQRLTRLQSLINKQAFAISQSMVGSFENLLVSGFSKKNIGYLQGKTGNNRSLLFPSSDISLIGQVVKVRILEAKPNSLRGELVEKL